MGSGSVISGRFRLDRLAGVGGMGSVYKAWDQKLGIEVAVKLLNSDEPELVHRFEREARVLSGELAALAHPGVVRHVAHGTAESGRPYLVMEWLEGYDLQARIRRAALTEPEAIALCRAVCSALAAVHECGIVHRDIKPSNLFLPGGELNAVKVLDFGVVRLTEASMLSITKNLIGTPSYTAPEQAQGRDTVDHRADLYALGAVLYACLTQRPPFTGENVLAVLAKLILDPTPRVSERRTDVSPGLDALIAHLMDKHPERRPQSAAAVVQALDVLQTSPSAYRGSSSPSISVSEQDFVTVLLIAHYLDRRGTPEALSVAAARFVAAMEPINDEIAAFVFTTEVGLRSAAARAARCALSLREQFAHAPIAIATGRRMMGLRPGGKRPLGEATDRAVAMVYGAAKTIDPTRGPVQEDADISLDDVSAQLIADSFAMARSPSGHYLLLHEEREAEHEAHAFIGRERELATLESALAECIKAPEARSIVVVGETGIGKSRLLRELLARITATYEDMLVLTAAGDSMRAGSAFDLLGQLLRSAMGILATQPLDERRRRIVEHVRTRMAAMPPPGETGEAACDRVAVFIGELCGVPFAEEGRIQLAAARRDHRLMHDQLRRAWLDWIDAETRARPVVCILDDLHWGDNATMRFLTAALRELASQPLCIIGLARPDEEELAGLREAFAESIQLRPLSRTASVKLLAEAFPVLPGELAERLVEQAAGNPFYLRELARARASGITGGIPETVLASVAARLNACSAEERRVLRAASVFGKNFWIAGVSALTKLPEAEVISLCEALSDSGFVSRSRASRFGGLEEYRFAHELTRDAAYATLTDNDRQRGHAYVAAWLETVGEQDPVVLAEHYVRGGMNERAAHFFVRAAELAFSGNDLAGVIEYGERAIGYGVIDGQRARARMLQAEAHNWRDEFAEGLARGREAVAELTAGSDDWAHAVHLVVWAAGLSLCTEEVLKSTELLLAHAPKPSIERDISRYIASVTHCATHVTNTDQNALADAAIAWINEATAVHAPSHLVLAVVAHLHGYLSLNRGYLDAAITYYRAAAGHWRVFGDERNACLDEINIGFALGMLGAYEESAETTNHVLKWVERSGADYLRQYCLLDLLRVMGRLGHEDRVMELSERLSAGTSAALEITHRLYRAQLRLWQGRPEAVLTELDAAQSLLVPGSLLDRNAWRLALQSQALLALQRANNALACAREAMEILQSLPYIEQGEGLIRLAYAEALDAAGERDEARRVIAAARERLLAQAALIESPTWRQSFLTRVIEHRRILELDRAWNEDRAS